MATLATTLQALHRHIVVRTSADINELFDANRLVRLKMKPEFTFDFTDPSGKLEFSFHLNEDFWNPRTEEKLQGRILYCESLDDFGRKWQIKVRFMVKFTEHDYEANSTEFSAHALETLIDYDAVTKRGKLHDRRFVSKFMRWLEPWDDNNPGGLFFNGRRVARLAEPKTRAEMMQNFSIGELDIGPRTYNYLRRVGIETIVDLTGKTEEELRQIPNFGQKEIDNVKAALKAHKVSLKK